MVSCRKIEPSDDGIIEKIIRTNLENLHMDIPGTVYYDPELKYLSAYYRECPEKRAYFVALNEAEQVIGGVGIAECHAFSDCAELQKLYLDDAAKGRGYGRDLIQIAETWAKKAGYQKLYLETHTNFATAIKVYERSGFRRIERPSAVAHGTMNRFLIKDL